MSGAHHYRIRPLNAEAHLFEVRLTVAAPDPDGQVFALPAWIPGSYMIRDYAKHVVTIRAEADGLNVPLEKLDKSRWRAAPVSRPLTVTAEIYAHDASVRGAHLDTTHAYFNGPCVFLEVAGQADVPCRVNIEPPEPPLGRDWRVATAMRRDGAEPYGFGRYAAADYAELIDHPVEIGALAIGEFEVDGVPHAIAIRGRTRVDMGRLVHDLETLCTEHMQFLGKPDDLDRYLFLLDAPGTGYGGLEHRWSSSLVASRDSLPRRGEKAVSDGYRRFLGLVSHEYFHLWNVKRLRPAAFTPYDLASETHTRLLWVFEGITSYYDDLALVRSGLIDEASYLELLGRTITRVLRGAGRHRQSVAESSFDAWTKFYKADANAANAVVSYYAKGALVALALDLRLRSETGGEKTLDDVMRACWARWQGDGMPEDGFEQVAADVSGLDLDDFFATAVHGTGELPLKRLLATHGVGYHLRAAEGRQDEGGKPGKADAPPRLWLGANLTATNGKLVFTVVHNEGPAERAGVAPGDVAVALDGVALTPENCDRRLTEYHAGDRLELVVFRGDELVTTRVRLEKAPATTCYLALAEPRDADTDSLRAAWLKTG